MTDIIDIVNKGIEGGAAALILKETLIPVEGRDAIFFPPTFAGTGSENSDYCIDVMKDGTRVCLVDSVGSQANRMEPIFTEEPYNKLIPRIVISGGNQEVNLCMVGHRVADALLKHSSISQEIEDALKAHSEKQDPVPLAKISPTSFVFGLWDSRGTQTKLARIISSTIRAYDVDTFTRSAQYTPPLKYREDELLGEVKDSKDKDARSYIGFNDIPATNTHGGIIAHDRIQRDLVLNFAALRKITSSDEKTEKSLQKYIIGLSMIAATSVNEWYLRQGCILTKDPEKEKAEWNIVYSDGKREIVEINHDAVLKFAQESAKEFGIGKDMDATFNVKKAEKSIGDQRSKKDKGK